MSGLTVVEDEAKMTEVVRQRQGAIWGWRRRGMMLFKNYRDSMRLIINRWECETDQRPE
jgi:hypothetical protein